MDGELAASLFLYDGKSGTKVFCRCGIAAELWDGLKAGLLASSFWLLASGCWLLASGF
jgi:hypothetical protein